MVPVCTVTGPAHLLIPNDQWIQADLLWAVDAIRGDLPPGVHLAFPAVITVELVPMDPASSVTAEYVWKRSVREDPEVVHVSVTSPARERAEIRLRLDPAAPARRQRQVVRLSLLHELVHAMTVEAFGASRLLFEAVAERVSVELGADAGAPLLKNLDWLPDEHGGTCGVRVPDGALIGLSPAFHLASVILSLGALSGVPRAVLWRWCAECVTAARRPPMPTPRTAPRVCVPARRRYPPRALGLLVWGCSQTRFASSGHGFATFRTKAMLLVHCRSIVAWL